MRISLLCPLLAAALAASLPAAAPLAGVSVTGTVWTNQAALPSGSSVYVGDVLETDAQAMAVIASPELGRIEVRPATRVTFNQNSLKLERGVVASEKLPVTARGFRFESKTAQGDEWFVVSDRDDKLLVAAYRGDVVIRRAGGAALLVPAGSYALAAAAPAGQGDSNTAKSDKPSDTKKRKRRRTGGGAAGAASKSGWTIGSLSHGASIALLTGVTAAAIGVPVALTVSDDSVSPQ